MGTGAVGARACSAKGRPGNMLKLLVLSRVLSENRTHFSGTRSRGQDMIIVTGSVVARSGRLPELTEISVRHVLRSRAEPGCVSHDVAVDTENANRLVFFERWRDMAALRAHFAQAGSVEFVRQAGELAAGAPEMRIYEAEEIAPTAYGGARPKS